MDSNTQNGDILERGSNDFDYISVVCGDHVPKKTCTGDIFRKITECILGAETRSANFLKTCFTGHTIPSLLGIQQPAMVYHATVDFVSKAT
jgi:hypothetical protein